MLAYVVTSPREPPRLQQVAAPRAGARDLLIRVLATSVNPVDDLVASGFFQTVQEYRLPAVFGRDLCGVVEQVGDEVTRFRPGQVVWGFVKRDYVGDGTFAEFVVVPEDYFVAHKSDRASVVEAGAMGLAAVTALECLDVLGLSTGDSVFVNRATGGVGSFAVQIAAARGLRVIATARPGASERYIRELGASDVVDWTAGELSDRVRRIEPKGVDGMVDLVRRDQSPQIGADAVSSQRDTTALVEAVLAPSGRFSSVTNGASDELLRRGVGFNVHSRPSPENLAQLNELVDGGSVQTPVTAVYPLTAIAEAFAHQRSSTRGKIAVTVASV